MTWIQDDKVSATVGRLVEGHLQIITFGIEHPDTGMTETFKPGEKHTAEIEIKNIGGLDNFKILVQFVNPETNSEITSGSREEEIDHHEGSNTSLITITDLLVPANYTPSEIRVDVTTFHYEPT